MTTKKPLRRVCLVTEEMSSVGPSGGIGGAFEEMALLLARHGATVSVLMVGSALDGDARAKAAARFARRGVTLEFLDVQKYAWAADAPEARSYAIARHLAECGVTYDVVHFHDYHGTGFFATRLKKQGLAFAETSLVVQLHGISEWTLDANDELPTVPEQLKIFFLERGAITGADEIVSPSAYLIDWLVERGFDLPPAEHRHVIHNVCTNVVRSLQQYSDSRLNAGDRAVDVDEIVMFGRHESRKGFALFVDALTRCRDELAEAGVRVTFLGKFGRVFNQHSGAFLARASGDWRFPVTVLPNLDRYGAAEYLASRTGAAVFVPSPYENSPYTVLELLALEKPLLTSSQGGARELIAAEHHGSTLFEPTVEAIAERIRAVLASGALVPALAEPLRRTEEKWLEFHERLFADRPADSVAPATADLAVQHDAPKVTLGITHYERAVKLLDAVSSSIRQSYRNLEIVVLDDGSPSERTQERLDKVEIVLERSGGRLIRAENGYLGAARNRIAESTDSEYLCFLDDDDYLSPDAIEILVRAAENTGADLVTCLNVFMPEKDRAMMMGDPSSLDRPVSFVPLGGPLALAPIMNVMGAATTLIRRSVFERVGGYTELRGVGHEDYELFVRALQEGATLDVVPLPLYLYEVDRPSMISKTNPYANSRRITDAIDTGRRPDDWRSLMEVWAGRYAKENSENRTIWESRRNGLWDLEERLWNWATPLPEQASLLTELSQRLGSPTAADTFQRLGRWLEAPDEEDPRDVVVPHRRRRERSAAPEQDGDAFEAQLALVQGDAQASARLLSELFEGRWSLSTEDLSLAERFATLSDVPEEEAQSLLGLVEEFEYPESYRERTAILRFRLARTAGDPAVMRSAFQAVADGEEHEYLRRNHDVEKAVAAGSFPSGLVHFLRSGRREGRAGFTQVSRLLTVVGDDLSWWEDERRPASVAATAPADPE